MKQIYRILGVLTLATALFSCSTSKTLEKEKAEEKTPKELSGLYLSLGTQALLRGEAPQAIEDLRKSVNLDATNTIALNHLGLAYYSLGKRVEAEKMIQRAVDIDPMYSDAHINLGNIALDKNDFKLARYHYNQAMENLEYKNRHRALTDLGQLALRENNLDEAKQYLFFSLQVNPDFCMTHFLLGTVYNRENNAVKAADEFKKSVISTCAKDVDAQYQLGLAYLKLKDFSKARKQLVYVMEQFPLTSQAKRAGDNLKNIP